MRAKATMVYEAPSMTQYRVDFEPTCAAEEWLDFTSREYWLIGGRVHAKHGRRLDYGNEADKAAERAILALINN